MRCWGSSKGLAVALCWSPGLKRSTRQRRTGLDGHRRECEAGVKDSLGHGSHGARARQTPSCLQIRVVFAGSLSLSGEDEPGGLVTGQVQMSRSRADRHSRLTWTTGCHVQVAAPHLQRRAVGGGHSIWVSALRGLGLSAQPQTPNHQEQIGRNLDHFLKKVSNRIQGYRSSIKQVILS